MPMKVSKLKTLPFVEKNSETVLKVEELVRFLRKHVTEGDKAISIDNLKLELSKKKELRTVDANTFVTFQGVIVYIFNHINDYAICQTIAAEISKVLCGKTDDSPKSILELYRDIANEQATLVRSDLNKTHGVVVPEVIFLEENTLNEYSCKQCTNDNYHKFHLRDDYFSGKLGNKIVHVLHEYDEDYIDLLEPKTLKHQDDDNKVYCEYCFQNISSHIFKPLDWKHFDLLKEWYLEVPLELQTIFGNLFINKDTLRRSDCSEGYLFTRIGKLYCLLDSGFNISNRKYHGILQQMNTEELIVNYHSISTVFDVTTQSGITKSLKSATRWLQARSDLDKRYYDAYLKQYPLEHKDPQGEVSKMEVCMRDCYNIVYLDNLVRWSIHADPDPGKNRTSQICTLPITIKGLPKQSYIIKSWHQQDCDLLVNCNCMQQIKLGKDQCKLLLEYEDKEKEALQILDVQTRLGIGLLVPALKTLISECTDIFNQDIEDENILDISKELGNQDIEDENIHISKELGNLDISMESTWLADIDTSMRSMKLDDYVDEDEPDDQNGINLDNLDESDEFLDDIIEEEDFFEGIQPLDISTEEHPQELTEDQDETPIENLIENMSTNTNDGTVPVNNVLTRTTFKNLKYHHYSADTQRLHKEEMMISTT
ncbi:unnamed protein product [Mytilus edulis]|uniref:Uncharacterized protein n=1 Tax=Mytilus edulis TaxID=6550 RepID=A0A8S3UFS7_MYTED|nr:unnamed protein product [Mytilus edulis]